MYVCFPCPAGEQWFACVFNVFNVRVWPSVAFCTDLMTAGTTAHLIQCKLDELFKKKYFQIQLVMTGVTKPPQPTTILSTNTFPRLPKIANLNRLLAAQYLIHELLHLHLVCLMGAFFFCSPQLNAVSLNWHSVIKQAEPLFRT